MGLLSFLSSTLSNLVRQEAEFRDCQRLLKVYRFALLDRQRDMIARQYIWYGTQGYSEDTYRYCWGNDGHAEVKARLEVIEQSVKIVTHRLHLKSGYGELLNSISKSEWLQWGEMIQQLQNQPWGKPKPESFISKIAFTISHNQKLQEELWRLRYLVEGLSTASRRLFRLQHGTDPERAPTQEEIQALNNTRALVKSLTSFASELFASRGEDSSHTQWSLELRKPDADGDATQTEILATIGIDFLIQCKCV
ncbi:hypothetical protein MMC12_008400 [Toensbergia leucococca]|nr:hypothetical protein [Toensbergia leucococca]